MEVRESKRFEQLDEMFNIKNELSRRDIPCSSSALERAILMPTDRGLEAQRVKEILDTSEDQEMPYPQPSVGLMTNPFPPEKKKKGKKGRKKK